MKKLTRKRKEAEKELIYNLRLYSELKGREGTDVILKI